MSSRPIAPPISIVIVCFACLGADTPKVQPPQSAAATDAMRKYDLRIRRAAEAYSKAIGDADNRYVEDLTAALKISMAKGPDGLEETKRIDAAKATAIDAMHHHQSPPRPLPVLVIQSATNGTWDQRVDVTKLIEAQVHNGMIVGYGALPGVPGSANTLTIAGTYSGQPFVLSFNAADMGNTLRFGYPSER